MKRAPRSLAGAGAAIVEAASQGVTHLGGVLARRRPPSASPSNRRMPEPNIGDRNSYGSCVDEFRTAKLRRGCRTFAHDQVRRRWSKIITIFQWVLIFEQSVNHRRGPRWWPQIGAGLRRLKSWRAAGCAGASVILVTAPANKPKPRLSGLSRS